jgi:hypothetical protein
MDTLPGSSIHRSCTIEPVAPSATTIAKWRASVVPLRISTGLGSGSAQNVQRPVTHCARVAAPHSASVVHSIGGPASEPPSSTCEASTSPASTSPASTPPPPT